MKLLSSAIALLTFSLFSIEPVPGQQYDDKVGFYENDSAEFMVSWSATGGLFMFDITGYQFYELNPKDADNFSLTKSEKPGNLSFDRNKKKDVTGFRLLDSNKDLLVEARRRDSRIEQAEVSFSNDNVDLKGLLLTPADLTSYPGVVFIHGSGNSDRNNRWYLYIAHHLVKNGISVLLPDKRGCGKSGGKWEVAGFDDFAMDAVAALSFMHTLEGINPDQTGFLGISQGGWIAPLAASLSNLERFIVNASGSVTTPNQQLHHEIKADIRNAGYTEEEAIAYAPKYVLLAKEKRPVWWEKNGDFDPIPYLESIDVPVLTFYGRKDEDDNVPVQQSIELLERISAHDRKDFITIVFDDSGHGLEEPELGYKPRKEFLNHLSDWILDR